MDNPFLKRLIKEKTEDVVHSSAYAKAQNPGGMGASSAESFAARMRLEQNRQKIRGYGDSRIANAAIGQAPRAKAFEGNVRGGVVGGNNGGGVGSNSGVSH